MARAPARSPSTPPICPADSSAATGGGVNVAGTDATVGGLTQLSIFNTSGGLALQGTSVPPPARRLQNVTLGATG